MVNKITADKMLSSKLTKLFYKLDYKNRTRDLKPILKRGYSEKP